MIPRWTPASPDSEIWDLTFPKRRAVYVCKAPGCLFSSQTHSGAEAHAARTGHGSFSLREAP